MKLYSTINSERAEKSQGGNNYLNIKLFVGDAHNSVKIAEGSLTLDNGQYLLYFSTTTGIDDQCIDYAISQAEAEKGKKTS